MPRTIFLYALLIALLIAGCTSPATSEPLGTPASGPFKTPTFEPFNTPAPELLKSKMPALDGDWTIKMKHSGGIMGLSRSIEISADGKFTVVDERAKKTVAGKFSLDELSKIKEQISTSEYMSPTKPEAICADCFVYDLEIQGSGKRFNIQLNDMSLPNSGLNHWSTIYGT